METENVINGFATQEVCSFDVIKSRTSHEKSIFKWTWSIRWIHFPYFEYLKSVQNPMAVGFE